MIFFVSLWTAIVAALLIALGRLRLREREKENKTLELYMLSMESCYEVLKKRTEAVRVFRHDLTKHIQTLEHILQVQNESEASLIKEWNTEVYCQNPVIHSVLEMKEEECRKKQIPLQIKMEDREYRGIAEIDLTGILFNLFDNAIEANERIENDDIRGITFELRTEEEKIKILMENDVEPGEVVDFRTKKEDKELHGYGLYIVNCIIQKYRGEKKVTYDSEKSRLRLEVTLNPDEK